VSDLEEENHEPEDLRRMLLEDKLRQADERLRSAMRARGFDPEQSDNLALTAPLAKLYAERENLRAELETLQENGSAA